MTISFVERVRRANLPPPPDDSVLFRVATSIAVLTGIAAAESVGELSVSLALASVVAISLGMAFSYATRARPWQWLKLVLALAVLGVFVVFVNEIFGAAHTGELTSIEVPLAGLFTWVQVVHAFDVPARRDLLFSLAAAGALITIAGAQASSSSFVAYVAIWLAATLVGLGCSWRSMVGERKAPSTAALGGCLALVLVVGLGLLTVLPQPRAARGLTLPASLTSYLPLAGSGLVTGSGANPTEPAQPGKPGGRIGVGGYVGFGGPLDTADRGALGNQVVLKVRADSPGYFLGMTYDTWNGQSWLQSHRDRSLDELTGGSPFDIPTGGLPTGVTKTDIQTFYVQQPLPNLLFATSDPTQVYFPSRTLVVGADGSLRSTVAMTPGTVYTVISQDDEETPSVLAADRTPLSPLLASVPEIADALELPYAYPRAAALARTIVGRAHARSTEAVVVALEGWIARNTEYSLSIPPLGAGQDAVNNFLFGNRRGYCEQISTALAVMLRTLHIPAREAVGYVPGPYDPLSGLYSIQAKDAHAWVQVFFPGYGWQSFDPTADVPLAPANPGSVLLHELWGSIRQLPWLPIGSFAGAGVLGYGTILVDRRRRRRPATWAGVMAVRIERLGRGAGYPRLPTETLGEYGQRLASSLHVVELAEAVSLLERHAYRATDGTLPPGAGTESDRLAVTTACDALARRASRVPHAKRRIASS